MAINYQELWSMGDALKRGSLTVISQRDLSTEDIWKLVKGETIVDEPMVYKYHMGSEPQDLIGTTWVARYLFADRIINALRQNRFGGWSAYPVKIIGKNGNEVHGYH